MNSRNSFSQLLLHDGRKLLISIQSTRRSCRERPGASERIGCIMQLFASHFCSHILETAKRMVIELMSPFAHSRLFVIYSWKSKRGCPHLMLFKSFAHSLGLFWLEQLSLIPLNNFIQTWMSRAAEQMLLIGWEQHDKVKWGTTPSDVAPSLRSFLLTWTQPSFSLHSLTHTHSFSSRMSSSKIISAHSSKWIEALSYSKVITSQKNEDVGHGTRRIA